jgi:hypothetical protein
MKVSHLAAFAAACSLAVVGCGGSGTSTPQTAMFSASLMDGPFRTSGGTVSAVTVTISKVQLIGTGGMQTIATFTPSQTVNLLNYQTTAFALGSAALPAGHYQQVRFLLDMSQASNTSVTVNGTTNPLSIPSATAIGFGGNTSTDNGDGVGTSGIKVNINVDAQGGFTYAFVIDFNAAESIVQANGQWLMKPVLVATAQATSGAISGTVKNAAGAAVSGAEVVAQQGGTTINSGETDTSGNFQINALPAGSYTIIVNNVWTSQAGQSETATGADGTVPVNYANNPVTVTNGQTTSITITD